MKRSLLFLFCIGLWVSGLAQSINVKSFKALTNDMTAASRDGKRIDQNGDVAALIKVVTTQRGFTFEGGALGIVDTKQENGEIWVWVPHGLRKMTVKHQQLGVLRDYFFPVEIEAERTYEMVLVTGKVETVVTPVVTQQFLVFNVTPKDAVVTVDNEPWIVIGGVASKMVDFGVHEYRVEAYEHHASAGKVLVDDPDNKVMLNVTLKQSVGYLKIEGNEEILKESLIYIDNIIGSDALNAARKLSSGKHNVRVLHPKYKPFEQVISIADGETYLLKVNLNVNYSHLTIMCDKGAELWVNGERKGVGSWSGDLEAGKYIMECKKEKHRPTKEQKVITEKMTGDTIWLSSPIPITGVLVVNSTPPMASIILDGKKVGETPMRLNSLLIGRHEVRLEKDGYVTLTKEVEIEDGKTMIVEESLNKIEIAEVKKEEPAHPLKDTTLSTIPSLSFYTLDFALGKGPQTSFGFSVGSVKRLGWFASVSSNFQFKALSVHHTCDTDGYISNNYPFYTGESCSTRLSAIAGVVWRVAEPVCLRAGVGFGMRTKCWLDNNNVPVKMLEDSYSGVDVSIGSLFNFGRFSVSVDVVSEGFKFMEFRVGFGMNRIKKSSTNH
jgi:hypothetical protein